MPRAGLDTAAVVRRARELVDADGLPALTLARLASELGVATPSLYKHIGGLEDLVNKVAAEVTRDMADSLGRASRGRSGRDGLAAVAGAFRRFALEHPGTYPLTQRRLETDEWQAAANDAIACVAAALSGYGVEETDVDRIRYVRSALHGFVDLELSGGFGLPDPLDASFGFLVDALDATLSALPAPESAAPTRS